MTHRQMWQAFSETTGIEDTYEAWAFGCNADELAQLVLTGRKTATSSLYFWYERENLELPKEESYSIVLDSKDNAVCIIKTIKVSVVPFCEVSAEHAWKEGEGDSSLAYWRCVHEAFFQSELEEQPFDPSMNVVCEEFIRIFP